MNKLIGLFVVLFAFVGCEQRSEPGCKDSVVMLNTVDGGNYECPNGHMTVIDGQSGIRVECHCFW